jgi:hypothetical protein
MGYVGIFKGCLVYLTAIWYFCGHLVFLWPFGIFVAIWYILLLAFGIFFLFWYVECTKKSGNTELTKLLL